MVDSSTATTMETFEFLKLLVALERVKLVFRFSCVATTVGAFEFLCCLEGSQVEPSVQVFLYGDHSGGKL